MVRRGLVVVLLLALGCSTAPQPAPPAAEGGGAAVRVASFDFAESRLLAELYAQALERRDVTVQRLPPVASREIMEPAVEAGLVDLVPEYVGTLLTFVTGDPPAGDLTVALPILRREMRDRGIRVLDPARAENANGVAVTRDLARRLDLRRISDLRPVAPQLRFGGPPECPERPLCLKGLRDRYGLAFASFTALDASGPLTLAAILGAEVDVVTVFTTSGVARDAQLLLLEDDLDLQPSENVVPIVREAVLARVGGQLVDASDAVSATLTTAALADLVATIESGQQDAAAVATAWLDRHGL